MPFALIALILVPAVAGSLRLIELSGGPHLMPANQRLTASPVPVVVHITSAISYAVLGALQFSPGFRRRHLKWHRQSGRVVVILGLTVAFSALCLTLFYPGQPGTGMLLYLFRLAFGAGMAACILRGFAVIRHGDVARHRAWMTRAYALALGAGTQVFTQGLGNAVFGTSGLTTTLMLGAGWAINLAVVEYCIRRRGRTLHRRPEPGRNGDSRTGRTTADRQEPDRQDDGGRVALMTRSPNGRTSPTAGFGSAATSTTKPSSRR
ncbi:DUF2306 domain-containing protein [Paeniglutamicibacter antarcticus]|uniref:DUF2306 domain-containing protein n=1 Tax=Arthrobacter terrae TaxID=2935737 RepID=A0A931CM67_9MICC|nr:DUF2306 domain-containing protein [Arthrobacter terrae]